MNPPRLPTSESRTLRTEIIDPTVGSSPTQRRDKRRLDVRRVRRGGGNRALSVVVPAFNERQRLHARLDAILHLAGDDTEVVLVDDGSTDGTARYIKKAIRGHDSVRLIRFERNRGKGAAVRAGIAASRGASVVFMDADLATELSDLGTLVAALRQADVAIGSRALPETVLTETTKYRSLRGSTFNRLVRLCSGLPLRDTQCGFKGFRAETGHLVAHLSAIDRFAFDVELLHLARLLGKAIVEVPIHWTEVDGSHVHPIRDPFSMSVDVIRARLLERRRAPALAALALRCSPHETLEVARAASRHVRHSDPIVVGAGRVYVLLPHADDRSAGRIAERLGHAMACPAALHSLTFTQVCSLVGSSSSPGLVLGRGPDALVGT